MKIEMNQYNPLFGMTPVSDLFFTRYLPVMDSECVKIYLYVLYLASKNENIRPEDLASAIGYSKELVSAKLIELQRIGLLNLYPDRLVVTNLGLDELTRSYRQKTTADPEEALPGNTRLDEKYRKVTKTVNDTIFNGHMPTDLYTDIILWVDKYGFEPETVYLLFQHCRDALKQVPGRPYILAVADNWGKKGIKTAEQVSHYLEKYTAFKKYQKAIEKKLNIRSQMTVFQEEVVQKWYYTYNYPLEVVDLALSKSVNTNVTSLGYYDSILSDWYSKGLKEPSEIEIYEAEYRKNSAEKNSAKQLPSNTSQRQKKGSNYSERKYDEDFLNSFVGGNNG